MPSTRFTLTQILNGDSAQLTALFEAAAGAQPLPRGSQNCVALSRITGLRADTLDASAPISDQLAPLLAAQQQVLAPALRLRLQIAEQLFDELIQSLDPNLRPLLQPLRLPFVELITRDDTLLSSSAHPTRALLSELSGRGSRWYPRDSKPSQQLFEKLEQLLRAAAVTWRSGDDSPLDLQLNDFRRWAIAEDKRAAMLESRLCESELAHLKLRSAECRVLDLLNNTLAHQALPLAIIEQIPALKSELQFSLINQSNDADIRSNSAFWKSWQRALPMLGRVFGAGESDADAQQLYRDIPALLSELQQDLHQARSNDAYTLLIDTLIPLLMQAIQKYPIECAKLPAFQYPDGYTDNHTRVTAAIMQLGQNIQIGDWFLFNSDNQQIRCKLALKIPDAEQLLFVDHCGRKAMVKSVKDFALCLSTRMARPLPDNAIETAIAAVLQPLIDLGDQHAQRQVAAAEQQKAEEQARRKIAAEKAKAEAQALAEEKQRRLAAAQAAEQQARALAQRERQAAQQAEKIAREKAANELLQNLNVGAWIEIASETGGENSRCKLSVVISASGKYIFVDHLGRKVAEYQREDLLQHFRDGSITVLSKGDKFEDQLAKVIRGLRKDNN